MAKRNQHTSEEIVTPLKEEIERRQKAITQRLMT